MTVEFKPPLVFPRTENFSRKGAPAVHQAEVRTGPTGRVELAPTYRSTALDGAKGAVAFVDTFERTLSLPPEDMARRVANTGSNGTSFLRANPALMLMRNLFGKYAKMQLFDRPAPVIGALVDSHLENFGSTRGDDGKVRWGPNDFDMVAEAPVDVDLKRLGSHAVIAAQELGLGPETQRAMAQAAARAYFKAVRKLATDGQRLSPLMTADELHGPVKKLLEKRAQLTRGAFLEKYVDLQGGTQGAHFKLGADLVSTPETQRQKVKDALAAWGGEPRPGAVARLPLHILDVASKPESGGNTRGLARYYVLVEHATPGELPVILMVKEELPSPLLGDAPVLAQADVRDILRRQAALGGPNNPLTGAAVLDGHGYLVKELEPEQSKVKVGNLKSRKELLALVKDAAVSMARAHAWAGHADALSNWIGSDAKEGEKKLARYAMEYVDRNSKDVHAYVEAKQLPAQS